MQSLHRIVLTVALACAGTVAIAAGQTPAVVHKPNVAVHAAPDLQSPTVATLAKDAKVDVTGQQGLWFQVATAQGNGFVRVNDVRMQYATQAKGNANAMFTGKAGKGRVS
jgi:beta-barrel assembly-enhancing protease